jgi:hypothetical protein
MMTLADSALDDDTMAFDFNVIFTSPDVIGFL